MSKFIDIEEYIKLSLNKRQSHINLNVDCIEIGGRGSLDCRGLLAHYLYTTIPYKKKNILLCHACHNSKCSNPKHLYWGTYSENLKDNNKNTGKTIVDHMNNKYGPGFLQEKARNMGLANKRSVYCIGCRKETNPSRLKRTHRRCYKKYLNAK